MQSIGRRGACSRDWWKAWAGSSCPSNEGSGRRFTIAWPDLPAGEPLKLGESVAINGCCLTVVSAEGDRFEVQAGPETLARTNLGDKKSGRPRQPRTGTPVSVIASGGISSRGTSTRPPRSANDARRESGSFSRFVIDPDWTPLLVPKGSIAVDGVSLTLVEVRHYGFSVMLIPHTLAVTTLGLIHPGDRVNIETDILAKHVQKLLAS